jgi:hypothetical protein
VPVGFVRCSRVGVILSVQALVRALYAAVVARVKGRSCDVVKGVYTIYFSRSIGFDMYRSKRDGSAVLKVIGNSGGGMWGRDKGIRGDYYTSFDHMLVSIMYIIYVYH